MKGIENVIKTNFVPSSEIARRFSMERFKKEYMELVKEIA